MEYYEVRRILHFLNNQIVVIPHPPSYRDIMSIPNEALQKVALANRLPRFYFINHVIACPRD